MAAAEVPRLTGAWFVVDWDATASRPNGFGVVVERAIEVVPGGRVGSEGGLEEEVESEFVLREKFFSEVSGEGGVDASRGG